MNNTTLAQEQHHTNDKIGDKSMKIANTDLALSTIPCTCRQYSKIHTLLSVIALIAMIALLCRLCSPSSIPFLPTNTTIVSRRLLSDTTQHNTTSLPSAEKIYSTAYWRVERSRREQLSTIILDLKVMTQQLKQIRSSTEESLNIKEKEYEAKHGFGERFWGCCGYGCDPAATYYNRNIEPINSELTGIQTVVGNMDRLSKKVSVESRICEARTQWNGGIAVVYNPVIGKAEWKDKLFSGVHGVWNPTTQLIEWREKYEGGIYGVWNPIWQKVEWKESCHSGVHGVWNPIRQIVEWKERYQSGVYGVWNPIKQIVEWKERYESGVHGVWNPRLNIVEWDTKWEGSVVGYFDEREQIVKWEDGWDSGVALIAWQASQRTYITSSCSFWKWWLDPPPPPP